MVTSYAKINCLFSQTNPGHFCKKKCTCKRVELQPQCNGCRFFDQYISCQAFLLNKDLTTENSVKSQPHIMHQTNHCCALRDILLQIWVLSSCTPVFTHQLIANYYLKLKKIKLRSALNLKKRDERSQSAKDRYRIF